MNIFQKYISYGLSVIPCKGKIPTVTSWKEYQNNIPGFEADEWTGNIAIICGKVSGGVVCVDFDIKNGNKWDDWIGIVQDQYPELLSKLVIESTPSGGYHVVFRTEVEIKNVKLACNKENKATIETRGEGGYFVCAPSENYGMYFGAFSSISKLNYEETEIVIQACKSLNEYHIEKPEPQRNEPTTNTCGLTPFDDYDSRSDIVSLLSSHGWDTLFNRGNTTYFRRPGKDGRGISASWNNVPDRFYVFSTSTQFENQHIYKASAVYSILEHGGDFSTAAKELSRQGFGTRENKREKKVETKILKPDDMFLKIKKIAKDGYPRGKTTGWKEFDKYFTVMKRQFTVITGMPSSGKSEFIDALAINLVEQDNWKFAIFSPENYPIELHYHKLIEKISGSELRKLGENEIEKAINKINDHFFFIDALEDDISLELILAQTDILIKEKNIDALIIDPWNEIELSKPRDINDSDFIGQCLRRLRKYARRNNIHLFVIAHPVKMQKNKDGVYPVPELYDIQGSSHWRNKADNGLCVHRDYANNLTSVFIQKIKFKYCGKQGEVLFKYDYESGRYNEEEITF